MSELQNRAKDENPDVIIVVESKLDDMKAGPRDVELPGYQDPIRRDRTAHGGGIIIWFKVGIALRDLSDKFNSGDHEVLWFSVKQRNGRNIVFGAVYRPPSRDDVSLLEYINLTVPSLYAYGDSVVLIGDFNLHNTAWLPGDSPTSPAGRRAQEIFADLGLEQCVHFTTRSRNGTANTLDLLLTDHAPDRVRVECRSPLGKSDHCVLVASLDADTLRENPTSRKVWQYSKADWKRLRAYLRTTDWNALFEAHIDPDALLKAFEDLLWKGIDQYVPSRVFKTRTSDPTWWTPTCAAAVKRKRRAYQKWKAHPSARTKQVYKMCARQVVHFLHAARKDDRRRIKRRLVRGKHRDRTWWRLLKRAGGDGRSGQIPTLVGLDGVEVASTAGKADIFGKYFASKCSLGGIDKHAEVLPPVRPRTQAKLQHVRFRKAAVKHLLAELDTTKALGPDNISTRVLRECAGQLAAPVARLFSFFMRQGVMPRSWKLANVTPVYKKKSKSDPSNYRPISLLSILSKIMESVINTQLVNYLEAQAIFSQNQFGFRAKLGTSDLLAALHYEWITTLNAGGCVRILAVDIAGAFDKVSHRGLLHKAEAYGISGPILAWLRDYLSDRRISAVVGGHASVEREIDAGVPQGSVLGPTLFLLYVNDLEDSLPDGVHLAVYADDTTLYVTIESMASVASSSATLQSAVDVLERWGRDWFITFEPTKSQCLTLTRHRADWQIPALLFAGVPVPEVEEIKLLGILIDQQLTFAPQLRAMALKARQRAGFTRRASRYLDGKGNSMVYKAFTRPCLEYAHLTWMGAAASHLETLDAVQASAVKLIGDDGLAIDTLSHRRRVGALTYLYKLQCWDPPPRLQQMVPPLLPRPAQGRTRASKLAHDTWHAHKLSNILPLRSLDNARRAFPFCVIDDWNSLPAWFFDDGISFDHLQTFKTRVHQFLGGKAVLNPALRQKHGRGQEKRQSAERDAAAEAAIVALGKMVDWGINHPRIHVAI